MPSVPMPPTAALGTGSDRAVRLRWPVAAAVILGLSVAGWAVVAFLVGLLLRL